jgi:hypothetical protein
LRHVSAATDLVAELDAANQAAIDAAPGCVPLHAAAIDTAAGVIAIAGQSGAGKSTLCAAAVRAGHPYVADEIASVDPDTLHVHPFHRPIGLRREGAAAIGVAYPDSSDGRYEIVYPWPVTGPLSHGGPLAGIVLVARSSDTPPAIDVVEGPAALLELSQHTVIADELLGVGFVALDRIVRAVPVARITYDTADQALDLLAQLIERWT